MIDGDQAGLLVSTADRWRSAAGAIASASEIAFDLEADGFHRYPEQVALMQVGLPDGRIYLIDPLALDEVDALGRALSDPEVRTVLHSADYDLRSLDRDFDFEIHGLFDTSVAATLVGARKTGLGNVLADVLEVNVPKPKRLQRMDWSRRPLPDEALAYAASDVAHLLDLAAALRRRLETLNRLEWVEEECLRLERVEYEPPDPPEEAFRSLRGAHDLSPPARAVLRELYIVRDAEARRIRRPPHRVVPNMVMLNLARRSEASLAGVQGIPPRTLRDAGERLIGAMRRGLQAEPIHWRRERRPNPWTPTARKRLTALRAWREKEAHELDLDIGVLMPSAFLEQVALHPETPPRELDDPDAPLVREWQWRELGPSLDRLRDSWS